MDPNSGKSSSMLIVKTAFTLYFIPSIVTLVDLQSINKKVNRVNACPNKCL